MIKSVQMRNKVGASWGHEVGKQGVLAIALTPHAVEAVFDNGELKGYPWHTIDKYTCELEKDGKKQD